MKFLARANRIIGPLVFAGLLLLNGTGLAQTQELVCDLKACVDYALTRSLTVKEADAKEITQTAAVLYEKTQFRPTLSLDASGSEINGEPVSAFSVVGVNEADVINRRISYAEYYSITLTFTYPLYKEGVFFGRNAPSVQIAESDRVKDTISLSTVKGDVVNSVSQLYLTAVKNQRLLKEQNDLIGIQKRKYEIVRSLAQKGLSSEEDANIAEISWRTSQQTAEQIQKELDGAIAQLSKSLGLGPHFVLRINGETPVFGSLDPLDTIIERALLEHPDIRSQRVSMDGAEAELDLSRSNRMPTLDFITNYTYADDFSPPGNQMVLYFLSLKMPIFDFGQNSAAIRQSEANLSEIRMTTEVVKQGIVQSITEDYSDVLNDEAALKVQDLEVQKNQLLVKQAKAKAEQQILTPSEVLDAEEALVEIRKARIEAEFTLLTAYVELRHTAGVPIGP